ncbi:MAG: hypothetical protein HQM14_16105 [SAR324 cluster bacterium]|nr:hypothetical protein [SAR324 cluster bacterium]
MKVFRFRLFILMVSFSVVSMIIYSILGAGQSTLVGLMIIGCLIVAWLFTGWFAGWCLSPLLQLFQLPPEEEDSHLTIDPDIQKVSESL